VISTHAEQDYADLIAASLVVGFLPKSALSADAIRDLIKATVTATCSIRSIRLQDGDHREDTTVVTIPEVCAAHKVALRH
jgi:hypothetical protein